MCFPECQKRLCTMPRPNMHEHMLTAMPGLMREAQQMPCEREHVGACACVLVCVRVCACEMLG
eukprot:scaffold17747_cov20-Tisochrysis_lutea.AAC.2